MSPTEYDLRASLRDGEGDEPNVDHIVYGARAAQSQRRTRILSTAAAVVVVAGLAVGGAELVSHTGNSGSGGAGGTNAAPAAAARAGAGSAAAAGSASGGLNSGVIAPEPAAPHTLPKCPATYPSSELPGGGSPGQFGASGMLFAKPVASIEVCTYATGKTAAGSAPKQTVLNGGAAQTLATSLEDTPKTRSKGPCPDYIVADAPSLAIIAVSTDGTVLPAVTTQLGRPTCASQVSNGTVVRYGWSPPASIGAALSPSTTTPSTSTSPSH